MVVPAVFTPKGILAPATTLAASLALLHKFVDCIKVVVPLTTPLLPVGGVPSVV